MIKLHKNEFAMLPEGLQVLQIKEFKAVPAGNPTNVLVTFVTEGGVSHSRDYDLSNNGALIGLSILIRLLTGDSNIEEIDPKVFKKFVGKFIEVEVEYTVKPSTKDKNKTVTFANITKMYNLVDGFTSDNDDDDDYDDEDDYEDDEDDTDI